MADWEDDCASDRAAREKAREERARRAAENRAWRNWRHARAIADQLGVLYGGLMRSAAAVAAWQAIADAVAECVRLNIPGANWKKEQALAQRRVAELTPPHVTRAEYPAAAAG